MMCPEPLPLIELVFSAIAFTVAIFVCAYVMPRERAFHKIKED